MTQTILITTLTLGANLVFGVCSARAQGGLGGYGAMAGGSSSAMSGGASDGGGMVAPFGGRFGSAMPSGMGGSSNLGFRSRPSSMMSNTRTAFTIGPMGGGMSGGMGLGSERRPFVLRNLGASGVRRSMPASSGMRVMPPSFASPFRPPTILAAPSSPGAGMSM